jgi:D-beta-D-heptose 7-phosphate kinase/D-beta-D-heptose 1-phosphate adenosyltransferase
MSSPVEIVRGFRSLRALCIGDLMLDSYVVGTASRLCSEGPVPVVRKTSEHHEPGGAANTAANLRALGAEVLLVGIVGVDDTATRLRTALQAMGISDRWLVEDRQATTITKHRILADGQYVVRVDEGDAFTCSASCHARLLERVNDAFARCDVVVVSDYSYGAISEVLIQQITELRRAREVPLVVDSKQLLRFRGAHCTVVTPNLLEGRLLLSSGDNEGDPWAVVRGIRDCIDCEYATLTMAADGVLLAGRDNDISHIPAYQIPNPADIGAGDSFAAALALALGQGADAAEAVRIGVDAAGVAVSKPGTAIVDHQELLQRVSLRTISDDAGSQHARARRLAEKLMVDHFNGRRVVFTNGVFDILHAGHIEFLREAKALGDVLVVGVNSDRGAARLKGKRRPINGERDRLALISALDAVDHAVLFDDDTPAELIRELRPDIHVKGGDYEAVTLPEEQAVAEVGGRVVILPLAGQHSTSAIIDRIVALATAGGIEAVHD